MISTTLISSPDGKAIKAFATQAMFEKWIAQQDVRHEGIWIRFFKKNSGAGSITYAEALDIALCYGWIDGPVRSADAISWIHKFTPRGRRSVWSQISASVSEETDDAGHQSSEISSYDGARGEAKMRLSFHKAIRLNRLARAEGV